MNKVMRFVMLGIVLALIILLMGCGSNEVIRYVDRPVKVEVPIVMPCPVEIPAEAQYATDRLTVRATDFEKIRALLVERKERGATETELRVLLASCVDL